MFSQNLSNKMVQKYQSTFGFYQKFQVRTHPPIEVWSDPKGLEADAYFKNNVKKLKFSDYRSVQVSSDIFHQCVYSTNYSQDSIFEKSTSTGVIGSATLAFPR